MQPLGIHHVNVTVGDLAAARCFYVDILGFTEREDRPDFSVDGAWLNAGNQQVHLVVAEPPVPTSDHYAILVSDLSATIVELRNAGQKVSEPMTVNRSQQAFLRDPWGNLIKVKTASTR